VHIRFDPHLRGAAWPVVDGAASFGQLWVGPSGLLSLLESQVGRGGPGPAPALRSARLVPALAQPGFWAGSAAVDPLGVAADLVSLVDDLQLEGWRGEGSGRLAELAGVADAIPPGIGARLQALLADAEACGARVEHIELLAPRGALPRAWADVIDGLERGGCRISQAVEPGAPQTTPQLVRPPGPLAAADAVAAWLAQRPGDCLIIGADVVLDRALRRHGMPTGGASHSGDNSLLQVLPLVLQLDRRLPDPQAALELLSLRVGPVPGRVARPLIKALHDQPAVGGGPWQAALATGLDALDEDRRDSVRARLTALFGGRDDRSPARLAERAQLVKTWLAGRRQHEEGDAGPFDAALVQCQAFGDLVDACLLAAPSEPTVQRLLRDATAAAPAVPRLPAQAGIAFVDEPGAVLDRAGTVVWWGFTHDSAPSVQRSRLRTREVAELAAAGVILPDRGGLAMRQAVRHERPWRHAQQLLLVCPEVDAAGAAVEPHPTWDTLDRAGAIAAPLPLPLAAADPLPLPAPVRDWAVDAGSVPARETESPSSVSTLLGCSLQWALRYAGGLRPGGTSRLTVDDSLLGGLVHELIAELLAEGPWTSPDDASNRAAELFASRGPEIAAPLFQPAHAALCARARRVTTVAAATLVAQLQAAGLSVVSVEQRRSRPSPVGPEFAGTADLVVGPRPGVIDLKWGGRGYRHDLLARGGAWQLAAYAWLESPGQAADVGYFILRDQRLLMGADSGFPEAEEVEGPGPVDIWDAAVAAWGAAWAEVEAGRLVAGGVDGGDGVVEHTALTAEGFQASPGCGFCDFSALCGRGVSP